MEVYNSVNEQLLSQTKQSVLLEKIEFKLNENENNLNDSRSLKQQYNFLQPDQKQQTLERCNGIPSGLVKQFNGIKNGRTNDSGKPQPKYTICSPNSIQLKWKHSKSIGAGYINLGNTCFMNSVLQALTYCPPLVNYLLYTNNDHINKCKVVGLCMTCELTKHIKSSYSNSGSVIRPQTIFSRLKQLARHFQPGRQEDSHEFLRYVIDNISKSCIINWESSHGIKLDPQSKETTFIHQIFGGYHRSQITCLACKAKSDTYDYFMDFILDIKSAASLERALEVYNQPEILRNENAYKCSNCNKKVAAEKRFSVDKAPNVATFQLKRFDYNRIFGGKITKQISYPEILNLRPYMSESKGNPINYKLFAVLVHFGSTSNSGHYFCYVRNSNQNWYLMDDARVSSTSLNQVLDQQAYMLFYVRIPNKEVNLNRNDSFNKSNTNLSEKSLLNSCSKLLITNHKPNGLIHKENNLSPSPRFEIKKPISNLPKLICDDVDTKQNGESILVNNNRFSLLSDINKKLNNNLNNSNVNKFSLNKSSTLLNNYKSEDKKDRSIVVKKRSIVPCYKNSSDDDQHSSDEEKKHNKSEDRKDESILIKKRPIVPYDNNSSDDAQYSSDGERKLKKHKRKHKKNLSSRDDSPNNSFHNCYNDSSNEKNQSNKTDQSSNQNCKQNDEVLSPQKNGNLGQQFNGIFNNGKKKDVKSELNEMHLNLLGKNVKTWTGKNTQIDREVKEDLEKDKKKDKDDLYNEEYDRGKVKKIKIKSDDDKNRSRENPFQKVYERQYINTPDKSKFIKSI